MKNDSRRQFVSAERELEIAEIAEAVADEYFPAARIEPTEILQAKGVTLSFGHYNDAFDGLLEWKEARFHVYCNLDRVEAEHSPRARFTLGHELGHYFIDEHRNALREGKVRPHGSMCEFESKNLAEQEADLFASNLLLPARRFLAAANRLAVGLPGVLSLARTFGTSITSTAVRYAFLGIKPCSVIKWSSARYAWKWLSEGTRAAGLRDRQGARRRARPGVGVLSERHDRWVLVHFRCQRKFPGRDNDRAGGSARPLRRPHVPLP